jgi:hypothetical protein
MVTGECNKKTSLGVNRFCQEKVKAAGSNTSWTRLGEAGIAWRAIA